LGTFNTCKVGVAHRSVITSAVSVKNTLYAGFKVTNSIRAVIISCTLHAGGVGITGWSVSRTITVNNASDTVLEVANSVGALSVNCAFYTGRIGIAKRCVIFCAVGINNTPYICSIRIANGKILIFAVTVFNTL